MNYFRPVIHPMAAASKPISLPPSQAERTQWLNEAALFATLGGNIPLDLFDPPFELKGYQLLLAVHPSCAPHHDGQTGQAGVPLADPIELELTDAGKGPIPNVPVTFEVIEGGGTLNGSTERLVRDVTDAWGIASVRWTIQGPPGAVNRVRALLHGYGFTFAATVDGGAPIGSRPGTGGPPPAGTPGGSRPGTAGSTSTP